MSQESFCIFLESLRQKTLPIKAKGKKAYGLRFFWFNRKAVTNHARGSGSNSHTSEPAGTSWKKKDMYLLNPILSLFCKIRFCVGSTRLIISVVFYSDSFVMVFDLRKALGSGRNLLINAKLPYLIGFLNQDLLLPFLSGRLRQSDCPSECGPQLL